MIGNPEVQVGQEKGADTAACELSVVIPTLNAAPTIGRALESLATQTYRNFDVHVVDGGSSDGTLDVAHGFADTLRLYISCQKDEGIYDAMNRGIRLSRGGWLYFLGGDDSLMGPLVLESVFASLSQHDADIMYGSVQFRHSGRVYDGKFGKLKLLEHNVCHQAMFYRRSVFARNGLFDTKYPYLADYAFNLRCFGDRRVRIRHIEQIIAVYNEAGTAFTLLDRPFARDRLTIVRNHLGLRYYLLARLRQHRWVRALAPRVSA